jgi:hypothetical protein
MKLQNGSPAKTTAPKKDKISLAKISLHQPTEEEIAKALAAKRPLPGDISVIQSLEIEDEEDEVDKYDPIVLSDTWYEFSVFAKKFHLHPKTAGKWLDNGWLAHSKIGRIRIINKFDIEEMMLYFRKPAIWE